MHQYVRTVLDSRKAFLELTIKQHREIIEIYKQAGKEVKRKFRFAKEGTLSKRYLSELDKAIENYRIELYLKLNAKIKADMELGAELGVAPSIAYYEEMDIDFKLKQSFKNMFTNISDETVKILIDGALYEDGKTLSQRIWNITERNGKQIDKIIKVALAEQKSVNELAKDVEGYIIDGVGKPQKTILKGIDRDISYQAVRLARTSMTHAVNESIVQGSMSDPFALGVKWNLSTQHTARLSKFGKSTDICDEYANQNNYGLGKGVFPAKDTPVSHPNCLCNLVETSIPIEEARAEIIDWINGADNPKLSNWGRKNGFKV